jgi:hypothetical protein
MIVVQSGRGGSWHPSVGMHLLRGELLAYNYAYILLDAINEIQQRLSTGADTFELLKGLELPICYLRLQ